VNGTEITPVGGVNPINAPLTAPAAPLRANETHTLNFELPAPTGIPASTDVDFRVDLSPVAGEVNTANNSGSRDNLTFVTRGTPNLFFTRINYTPAGAGLPALATVQPGVGNAFVQGIYPVNDADPNLYREGLFPTLPYGEDANGDGRLDALGTDGDDLLSLLASCRQLIVNAGLGAANNTFLYGWIAGNPIDGNGLGQISGFNAFGNTELIRYQRSYAHELGHNFGLQHSDGGLIDQVGWDVGARLPNNPAGNNTVGRVKPTTLNDVMTPAMLTNQAWVKTSNYTTFAANAALGAGPDVGGQEKFLSRVAVLQGIFNPRGDSLIRFEPVFRYPWTSQPTSRRQTGRFVAEVVDDAGAATRAGFNAQVGSDTRDSRGIRYGFFEVMVPVAANREIASVRILDNQRKQTLVTVRRTRPPTVRVVAPVSGAQLRDTATVEWTASDPDTPADQLMFQLAYSADGGRSWVPIGVDLRGTRLTFPSSAVRRSKETGVIRVFVSDGLNTTYADVRGLSAVNGR